MEAHLSDGKDGGKDNEKKLKNRLMGKLFKEKKTATQEDVNDFLHGSSDKLYMMPTSNDLQQASTLPQIDTSSARRWPTAAQINNTRKTTRPRSTSPKRSRKGLVVRFTDEQPEVIGEGGDEATTPVSDIGVRRRANTHPPVGHPTHEPRAADRRDARPEYTNGFVNQPRNLEDFRPEPIRRMQTGSHLTDVQTIPAKNNLFVSKAGLEDRPAQSMRTETHDPASFAARVKAEMRTGEGRALLQATSNSTPLDQHFPQPDLHPSVEVEITPGLEELHIDTVSNTYIPLSTSIPMQVESVRPHTPKTAQETISSTNNSPAPISKSGTFTLQDAALAVGDDALKEFSRRTARLFMLFQLSAESVKPLPQCSLQELVRLALWWFLKGRLTLEASIRDRPTTPEAQQANLFMRQQAHADLAKSLWIIETVTPQSPELHQSGSNVSPQLADNLDSRRGIMSSLKKLAMSMKRNNILPPRDALLPQGIDNTIWVQDDGNRSLIASQRFSPVFFLSDSFPLGDSGQNFHYGRIFVEAVLLEDSESQYYRCQTLLSILRGQNENGLIANIASQDGLLNISIQSDRARGPTWEGVVWQADINKLEIRLPRGFILQLHCAEHDFRILWGIYDHHRRIHSNLDQRRGEDLIFEATVRTFQQFELAPSSVLPKEPLPYCHLRVFEKSIVEKAANGARTLHRGFRLALCSNPKTKTLKGINQSLPPHRPIEFGFLRGEGGLPAFLLKTSDDVTRHNIVFTFEDVSERARLYNLLTGVALDDVEDVVAEAPMTAVGIENQSKEDSKCLKNLEWQNFRVINETYGELQSTKTVFSEHLRVILDFKTGTLTDRINVGPGELKLRLDVKVHNQLKLLRQPQLDMTASVSESQVSKELPSELKELLRSIAKSETTRTYTFPDVKELHLFQSALTGFNVVFDGVAASFNIARRRMVVPIYKKWDAATTRVQLVQKDKVVQLVAFFENFSHGDCLNFTLKSTDIFETSSRSSKFSLKIVDAKFALPKGRLEGESGLNHEFVCLDMPEYPGEHDDISIVFDTEVDLERFVQALPAPAKTASRIGSVRR